MLFSLSFNGIKKDYLICERGKRRSAFAPIKRNLLTVPGVPGAYLDSTETEVRVIEQPIIINGKDRFDVRKLEEDLSDWLITEKAVELTFDEEPDRIYYAVVDGAVNIEDIARFGKGSVTFICPDPYKYGPLEILQPITEFTLPTVINNSGRAPTPPKFKVTLKNDTTFLDIIGDEDYMRIGRPVNIDEFAVAERELVLHDTMSTTTGWGDAQNSDIDGGVVAGTMISDGTKFIASSLGTGTAWHGPAKIKSLGQELTDFDVEFQPILDNDDLTKIGRIELYLLDVNKKAVAKLAIKDISKGQGGNIAELRVGDNVVNHFMIAEYGTNWNTWHNFNGLLQITKKGNMWTAYVAKFINGDRNNRTSRKFVEWEDRENQFTRKVAHVVVHIGANGTATPSRMSIQDLRVSKLNQLTQNQIPYIGRAGDVFEFDMKISRILKNGDFFMRKDFGARFFHLQKGDNVLVFNPPEVIEKVEAEWRQRFK
ncbi:phage tail family protein [Bacillus sp. CMF12]|uniref:distal tail protein Dit n=1 Tax=Bacillus sp. CMF12 TaxID=2884834 RepID=UPI00207925C2|nr:distal tail protein Dit [Bacillus sp. CMF12]USK48863.1 phage tail family protein [Bacillus sp. CMF12]